MFLPSSWNLPQEIKERFGQREAGKQRAMVAEQHLVLILHKVPKPGSRKRQAVFFWRNPQGEWAFSGGGDGLSRLKSHVKTYSDAEIKLAAACEAAASAADYFHLLQDLGPLQRAAQNLLVTLQAAREAVHEDRQLIDLRDEANEVHRTLELIALEARHALDYELAQQAEEQARLSQKSVRTAQRLNILAAIFLPLTALSSLFGMNLPTGLPTNSPVLFWMVFGAGVVLGMMVRDWVLRGGVDAK